MSDKVRKENGQPTSPGSTPGGATRLMGMFDAPPNGSGLDSEGASKKGASDLTSLFAPPPKAPPRASIKVNEVSDRSPPAKFTKQNQKSPRTLLSEAETPPGAKGYGSLSDSMKATERHTNFDLTSWFDKANESTQLVHDDKMQKTGASTSINNVPSGLRLSTSFSEEVAAFAASEANIQKKSKTQSSESNALKDIFLDSRGERSPNKMKSPSIPSPARSDFFEEYEVPVGYDVEAEQRQKKSTTWWDEMHDHTNENSDKQPTQDEKEAKHWRFNSWSSVTRELHSKCFHAFHQAKHLSYRHIFIGSILYTLYNIVFCLALASGMSNLKYRSHSMLGPIARVGTMGAIAAIPFMLLGIGGDLPALYPTVDLFLAPFLMRAAQIMDENMNEQMLEFLASSSSSQAIIPHNLTDEAFVATFIMVTSIGMLLTAFGNYIASRFKLANIGAYLPYAVLCGFFSFVGVTLWTLAISVDTGMGIGQIFFCGSWSTVGSCFLHHIPGAVVGISMFIFGPRFAILVPTLILFIILVVHLFMIVCGISLERAQENDWFWTGDDLVYEPTQDARGLLDSWHPTKPFGVVIAVFDNKINYKAIRAALPPVISMAFLYVLRCYLHATALRKSSKIMLESEDKGPNAIPIPSRDLHGRQTSTASVFSEDEYEIMLSRSKDQGDCQTKAKMPDILTIVKQYGFGFFIISFVGTTTAVLPSIAVAPSIFKLGAKGLAPQYCSLPFLLYFYLTNFSLVQYIPKMVFSSLLVLSSIEMLSTWFFKSYFKIQDKLEWLVAPLIVAMSFVVGPLQAVGLGIAISTFIFVSSFFKSGVVKFIANGLTIRSTIERNNRDAVWLDQNGDMIQVIVLQNYLFFGNASSCMNYIDTMFEEYPGENEDEALNLPPIPKSVLLDLSLVTGMDASTVDIFSEISSLCRSHKAVLYIVGASASVKSVLGSAGFRPSRSDRYLRFVSSLEIGLGKAEDGLLSEVLRVEELEIKALKKQSHRRTISGDSQIGNRLGFRYALEQIDQQHEIKFTDSLTPLENHTIVVELKPGESLFDSFCGGDNEDDRGLFFIENGIMRVERDSSYSVSRGSGASLRRRVKQEFDHPRLGKHGSVGQLNARSRSVAKIDAMLKGTTARNMRQEKSKFRLARIGPGFVVGVNEASTGLQNIGIHIAVTECRLYFLPYDKVREIEKTDASLVLNLYKLLAHLSARREEMAIEQLSTLHTIMTSDPVGSKPMDRKTLGAIQRAMISIDG